MMIFIYLLAANVIMYILPRGRLTDNYDVFIAADPKTVWGTYFIHVSGADYRPGSRLLDYEFLSVHPLTVRITVKANFLPMPLSIVETFDLYEPYTRYELRGGIGSLELAEEGELVSEPGGTRLRFAVTAPKRGLLLPWLARRRAERNLRALQEVGEGRNT